MRASSGTDALDRRILIFAPVGKDAPLTLEVLRRTDLEGYVCESAHGLCLEFASGAAVVLLTEEALEDRGIDEFMDLLRRQPPWSDIPVLLFADTERSEIYLRTLRLLEGLRNVVLLERPIRLGAVLSLIRSAMRGRERQYELRDLLTAIASAREDAETANRLKDEFLATLSHELRTPLNAILGWTTMLRDGDVQPRHVMRALETIHRNATAQVQIVNDLLDVSRIVRGNVQLSPQVMSLGPLLALAVESIMPTAEAKGVSVGMSIGVTPAFVWADHDRLQQVFWNLLSNAVKFTSSGGRVDVRMDTIGSEVRVDVSDTGSGIPPSFLPHVFERFRQADGSSTRMHGGLGLGLSIGRHLVELHGGRMAADSGGEGHGATFSVYLPLRDTEPRAASAAPVEPRTRSRILDLDRTHVLIVDDDPDARELMRMMLSSTGARISEAETAAEALRRYSADRPDIILADVAMLRQDGYALMRAIRNLPASDRGHARAIAISAFAGREGRQRALRSGFDDHICKPVQMDNLYDVLERVSVPAAIEVKR